MLFLDFKTQVTCDWPYPTEKTTSEAPDTTVYCVYGCVTIKETIFLKRPSNPAWLVVGL